MPAKSRFTRLDAFTKTVEDARIRTTSGGTLTLLSLILILYLTWTEWSDYRRIVIKPELIVDNGRAEKMEIHMNVSFPRMPCELVTLDVMDVSGEVQSGVMHGVNKVRLRPENEGGGQVDGAPIQQLMLNEETEALAHLDPNYCGECYGAPPPPNARKSGCCNTCAEVRDAYAGVSWSFGKGEGVEQCQKEHYGQHLDEQRAEGCRVEGNIRVNKVVGNFHFAPGKSFSNGNMHVHDMDNYYTDGAHHTFTHKIHHLRFGPELPSNIVDRVGKKGVQWSEHHLNPLDDTEQKTDEKAYNYMYFVKVVSTAYLPLGWERTNSVMDVPHELIALGGYGKGDKGSIETHQYSVTSHHRNLAGGDADDEGHKERLHAKGGIPGVFFSYDISPMKVINREAREKSFTGFLVGVCAVIGGTLTVAAALDRLVYEGTTRVKKTHSY